MDAFDADVLIYAAAPEHELGRRVVPLLARDAPRVGSALLIPELLGKPLREGIDDEVIALSELLSRLELRSADEATCDLAAVLGATYGLRAVDSVHLATAVAAGAERFITNNTRDLGPVITEIAIVTPADLAEPEA